VEINSSFYRSHQQRTYARWRQSVPREFRFSVKIPRTVTHNRRLHDTQDLLLQFVDEVAGLQEKLGCLLVQLPPSLHFEESVAFRFFTLARRYFSCQIACEARHASWFASSASLLLNECSITRVFADPAIEQNNGRMPTTAAGYRRLHGQPQMYYSAYGLSYLRRLADELIAGAQATALQWCIFDNTAEGAATSDALLLKSILDPGTVSQAFNGPPDGEVT
jgi:uncharacterized protein YecE (DUF72 family)